MQTTGIIEDISIDYKTRKSKISLLLDTKEIEIVEQLKNENKLNVELKKYRQKRSINANNYFWKLLQELCDLADIETIQADESALCSNVNVLSKSLASETLRL